MLLNRTRSVVSLIVLLAAGAMTTTGADRANHSRLALDEASELLREGSLIEARHLLRGLDRNELEELERERAFELMTAIDRRLRNADQDELNIQRAMLAIRLGDLREADRLAHAVRRSDGASSAQRQEAADLLTRASESRLELIEFVGPAIEQAILDFENGMYPEAKAHLDSVHRSGVRLTTTQLRMLERTRDRIMQLEKTRGRPFEFQQISLGLLQPGTVTRREDPAADRPETMREEQPDEAAPDGADEDMFIQALRFDAQRLLAEADRAFEAGRYSEAMRRYSEVVAAPYREHLSNEEATQAESRMAEIRVRLQLDDADQLEELVRIREIMADQSRAEFDNFISEARQALSEGDTERARNLAAQARLRLADSRDLFSETEYSERLSRQQNLLQEIIAADEQIRQRQVETRERRLAQESQQAELRRQREIEDRINESLNRVRALQMEQKYQEALQIVDQILFLDPQHPTGLLLKDVLQDVVIFRDFELTQRAKSLSYSREFNEIQRSKILPRDLLEYPPDWPELSIRRGEPTAFAESPADRRMLAEIDSRRIPASFRDNTLEDVLEFVARVTNLNMDVDWDSLADIGVDRDALVTLNLQPMPVRIVLNRVLEKVSPDRFSRANWAVNDGLLVVASDQDLRKNTFIQLYDVRDMLFQIPSFTEFPALDLDSVLAQRRGGGAGGIFRDTDQQGGDRRTKEELKDALIEIIQTNVDFEGWRDNGGDTGIIQELNDNLIITNTARNHRAINGLLRQLREVRAIQINVEARFLVVTQDFFEQIGFDIDVIFNAQNSQFKDALAQQEEFGLVVTPQGGSGRTSLLPSNLIAPFFNQPASSQSANIDFTFQNPGAAPGTPALIGAEPVQFVVTRPDSTSMIPVQQNSNNLAQSLLGGSSFATDILSMSPAIGIAGTFLDDIQVDFLVEATQADRRNVVMTMPRLTFTNGHAANIFVTTQTAFVSDLAPVVGTNAVAFDPTVDVINTGFTLGVEGVVSADRRYVTLTLQTQLAELVSFAREEVSAQTGGGTQQGVPSGAVTSDIQLPIVQVTSLSTGATVPDKGTLLVGGQRLSSEVEVETGVPVLSKLPIINRFFTNRIQSKEEQTLLILIKPTILIQNEEEEKNFPGLLDSLQNRFDSGF